MQLSISNSPGTIGSSTDLTCTAILSVDVSGAMIEFDYGFVSNTLAMASDTTQNNVATISPVELFSAGEYTCTVTVTASGVCGGGGSEPDCPTKTSDAVALEVQCESGTIFVLVLFVNFLIMNSKCNDLCCCANYKLSSKLQNTASSWNLINLVVLVQNF